MHSFASDRLYHLGDRIDLDPLSAAVEARERLANLGRPRLLGYFCATWVPHPPHRLAHRLDHVA